MARINGLEERLEVVESQLKKNSRNSSKPPSSDGFKKQTKSLRQESERSSGGQIGHSGQTLEWRDEVTHVLIHPVRSCRDCGTDLAKTLVKDWEVRQVHDWPKLGIEVSEHQCEVKCCPNCGILNRGTFPSEAAHPIQYGPNVESWIVYLMDVQLIPSLRICELFSQAFNVSISEGTLYNIRKRCFEGLESSSDRKSTRLNSSHVD